MAMYPAIARQNKMGGASSYITCRLQPHLRFLRRKQPSVQFIARPGTVLIPISQGTEVTKVTEYVPFRYFTRTVIMGTSDASGGMGSDSNGALQPRGGVGQCDSTH